MRTEILPNRQGVIIRPPNKFLEIVDRVSPGAPDRIIGYYERHQDTIRELYIRNILSNPSTYDIMENYQSIFIQDGSRVFNAFIGPLVLQFSRGENEYLKYIEDTERDGIYQRVLEFFAQHHDSTIRDVMTSYCESSEARTILDEKITKNNEWLYR